MIVYHKKGSVAGTAAAINIPLGFIPSVFRIYNPNKGVEVIWRDTFTAGTGIKRGGASVLSSPAATIGTTPANLRTNAFCFTIASMSYARAAVAAGTALTATTVPQNTYGAFGLTIDAAGTLANVDAAGNATGYASAALARAALLTAAAGSLTVVLVASVIVINTAGAFVGATTSLAAAGVTAVYENYVNLRPKDLISPYAGVSGTTGQGITIGLDLDLNVSGETLYYEAIRGE